MSNTAGKEDEAPLCDIRLLCTGATATHRCNTCGQHGSDNHGYVDYCSACFAVRHTSYSLPHHFLLLEGRSKKDEQWDSEFDKSLLYHNIGRFEASQFFLTRQKPAFVNTKIAKTCLLEVL